MINPIKTEQKHRLKIAMWNRSKQFEALCKARFTCFSARAKKQGNVNTNIIK